MIQLAVGITVAIVCLVAGDFLLKQGSSIIKMPPKESFGGAKGLLKPSNFLQFMGQADIFNWKILMGIAVLGIYFGGYLMALNSSNVSLVVPLMAMSHVLNALVGKYRLHEDVGPLRWSGIATIIIGVFLLVYARTGFSY